jgi:hypothetical protein
VIPAPPPIDSQASFVAALRWGFDAAFAQPVRRIVCVDGDFAAWPLDEPVLLDALTTWLRLPQRRLVLLARSYDEVPRRSPRFTAWRRDWAHTVEAWQPPDDLAADLPTLLLADTLLSVQLLDALRWRGRTCSNAREIRPWSEQIDALLQQSSPAFSIGTLGL